MAHAGGRGGHGTPTYAGRWMCIHRHGLEMGSAGRDELYQGGADARAVAVTARFVFPSRCTTQSVLLHK